MDILAVTLMKIWRLRSNIGYPLLIGVYLSGCVGLAYSYNGVSYPNSIAALNAQQQHLANSLNNVNSIGQSVASSAIVVIANVERYKISGIKRLSPGVLRPEQIEYISSMSANDAKMFPRVVRRLGVFDRVDIREQFYVTDLKPDNHDYIVWQNLSPDGNWQWYVRKKGNTLRLPINIDRGLGHNFVLKSWGDSLVEAVVRLKGINNRAQNTTERRSARQKEKVEPSVKSVPKKPKSTKRVRSGSGSGFFVSRLGHVVTNAHVVNNCERITVGDSANNQSSVALVSTDKRNDLALLKLGSLETASAGTKSLVRNLGLKVMPHASEGLLRSQDVVLGENVLVAGFPFGNIYSSSIKVTGGMVSAVRGLGDDTGQFQLDAAVQSGNSGGPIYDANGNIVGVVVAQLNKLKVAKAIGSFPENVNFGIKASTVWQFLTSSGLPSIRSIRTIKMTTSQLAQIAQKQTLMVICHRNITTVNTSIKKGQSSPELTLWQSIKDSSDPSDFERYLKIYPSGNFVDIANIRIARIHELEKLKLEQERLKTLAKQRRRPTLPATTERDFQGVGSREQRARERLRRQLLNRDRKLRLDR